jgi:transcription elongation factor Elf1
MDGDVSAASEAFEPLGSETRMAILEGLVAEDDGSLRPVERTFTELFETTDEGTTAGFSYHLRQLRDRYVEQTDEGYRLTYAGEQVVRQIAAGTFTESVDHEAIEVADPCPFCGETAVEATGEDNVLTVGCAACDRDVLSLPFPPAGHATHEDEALLDAFDRHHRHRIALMADGSCPACGGAVEGGVVLDENRPQARLECTACGDTLRCPVTLTLLSHPEVVAFYHEHDVDLRDRPLWNVGEEWSETVLSEDPLCVRVATSLDGDLLVLLVGRDLAVGHVERSTVEADAADGETEEELDDDTGADAATA